jgi:hypothetical protein
LRRGTECDIARESDFGVGMQVWAVNLSLYALHVGGGSVGEPWLTPGSWLQLLGFAILLAGTIVYGQVSLSMYFLVAHRCDGHGTLRTHAQVDAETTHVS